jgi:hypothetical protein
MIQGIRTSIGGPGTPSSPVYQTSSQLKIIEYFLNGEDTCSDGGGTELCLAISRSCASRASKESHFLQASFIQPRSFGDNNSHELVDGPRLFLPKIQLTLHHELEVHARLTQTF